MNTASSIAPKSRKHTPEQEPTHIKIGGGRLNSERETYLWRTHGIINIGLKRHLRLWMLVGTVARPTTPPEPHHADLILLDAPSRRGLQ